MGRKVTGWGLRRTRQIQWNRKLVVSLISYHRQNWSKRSPWTWPSRRRQRSIERLNEQKQYTLFVRGKKTLIGFVDYGNRKLTHQRFRRKKAEYFIKLFASICRKTMIQIEPASICIAFDCFQWILRFLDPCKVRVNWKAKNQGSLILKWFLRNSETKVCSVDRGSSIFSLKQSTSYVSRFFMDSYWWCFTINKQDSFSEYLNDKTR